MSIRRKQRVSWHKVGGKPVLSTMSEALKLKEGLNKLGRELELTLLFGSDYKDKLMEDVRISETPERWVVLEIIHPETKEKIYKVFGSWAGGYLDGDRWKLNSGVKEVKEDEDYYYFVGYSGSCYKCAKMNYGVMTSFSQGILDRILENSAVEQMSEDTNFMEIV